MGKNIYSNRDSDGVYNQTVQEPSENKYLVDLGTANKDVTGAIAYDIGPSGKATRGQENLVQRVIKSIFTLKGSDAYDNTVGSNFFHLFGTIPLEEVEQIKSTIPVLVQTSVDSLKKQDINYESQGGILEPNEKLSDLLLENVVYDEAFGGWLMTLRIITAQNNSILITV